MTKETGVQRRDDIASMIMKMEPQLARAVPSHVDPRKMARIALTAVRVNPKLAACTPQSFLGTMMSAATLGLEVNTPLGHAYLVPYGRECTLIIGYRGMLELARRSGVVSSVYATVVREGDTFRVIEGLHRNLVHEPALAQDREDRPITHVYAVAHLASGEPLFAWLSKAQVDARRKRSRSGDSGPWATDYEAMARKSAVRALFPWIPQSTEIARAIALDDAAERGAAQVRVFAPEVVEAIEQTTGESVEVPAEEREQPSGDGAPAPAPGPGRYGSLEEEG